MGFIFGLIVGSALSSGGTALPPILGTIPFRCLAAFEESDAAYRQCRTISLRREIYDGTSCNASHMSDTNSPCSFDKAIAWEIAGLRELKRASEQKQTTVR